MEEKATFPLLTAIKMSFSLGSVLSSLCWELLSQTYSAIPCEHRDLVSLSRKIMNHNPNILQQFKSGSSQPLDFTESKNCQ